MMAGPYLPRVKPTTPGGTTAPPDAAAARTPCTLVSIGNIKFQTTIQTQKHI